MLKSGLVSVTFRKKTPLEIVKLCEKASLDGIEWGGDCHVVPREGKAREVLKMTRDHGLAVSSYGSYFRLTQGIDAFQYNLEEAVNLEAPVIRIWAGVKASSEVSEAERAKLIEELMAVSEIAHKAGVQTTLEYHGGTLTDCRESAVRLVKETAGETYSPYFYWQPRWDWTEKETLASLDDIKERLSHFHVFCWQHMPNEIVRLPLSEGEALLKKALIEKENGYALIEFVKDDKDEALLDDAATLNQWLKG